MPLFLVGLLKKARKKQEIMRQKAGEYWQNEQCFIFTNEIGKPFVHETVRVHFKKALKRAWLPETIRFHDLRHPYVKPTTKNIL